MHTLAGPAGSRQPAGPLFRLRAAARSPRLTGHL